MAAHQVLIDFLIESRLETQYAPRDCRIHQKGTLTYVRQDDPEILSATESVHTNVGLIWTATLQGGFDQDVLNAMKVDRAPVQQFIDYCRGTTYAQRRILGRTIKGTKNIYYMDIGIGNIFDFTAEETVLYLHHPIFKLYSRGSRVT